MDDNAKRIGSAVFTTIIIIIWVALRAESCKQESSYDDYDYSVPSFSYNPPQVDLDGKLDKAKKALDELMAQDAAWEPAVQAVDAIAIAHNPKNVQCQALDEVIEQTPTWKVDVSDTVLANDTVETEIKSPYPLYVTREDDAFPKVSPESIARSHVLIEKVIADGSASVPSLTTRDLVVQVGIMPKPAKGARRVKGAIAAGKPIVRGWIYDHHENRVVCAGVMLLPKPAAGENATRITDEQLAKIVADLPSALKTTPLPDVEKN